MTPARPILTIGHSRHSWERFAALLEGAGVEIIADIRTAPRSRFSPHFNKEAMAASLAAQNIAYVFLGKELGGRPRSAGLYTDGVADYEKMAAAPDFRRGLEQLMETAARGTAAVMCSEADPLDCHRCLLVGRALAEEAADVRHILASGAVMTQGEAEDRLLQLENLAEADLLAPSRGERLAQAYRARARKHAFAQAR
ncbi:MAG: DUF488 family protein [Methyloceanibacter sp.]